MLPVLSTLSPNAALLILTAGLALVAIELNRPGTILPGAAGLLLTLLAAARLWQFHPDRAAIIQSSTMFVLLLLQAWRPLNWIIICAFTLILIFALRWLIPPSGPQISLWVAISCGVALGAGITVLTRIARRARQNKGLD